jgi:hypothetical protein
VLGAEDVDAMTALSAQKNELVQALVSAGVKLSSVKIVPASEVGILLARTEEKPPTDPPKRGEANQPKNSDPRKRHRKLDLTG